MFCVTLLCGEWSCAAAAPRSLTPPRSHNPTVFSSEAHAQSYKRRAGELGDRQEQYEAARDAAGADFYRDANDVELAAPKPTEQQLTQLTAAMAEQHKRRLNWSRRRRFEAHKDADYVNDKNRKFNQLLARNFDPYTQELRQNLERGTAL